MKVWEEKWKTVTYTSQVITDKLICTRRPITLHLPSFYLSLHLVGQTFLLPLLIRCLLIYDADPSVCLSIISMGPMDACQNSSLLLNEIKEVIKSFRTVVGGRN